MKDLGDSYNVNFRNAIICVEEIQYLKLLCVDTMGSDYVFGTIDSPLRNNARREQERGTLKRVLRLTEHSRASTRLQKIGDSCEFEMT